MTTLAFMGFSRNFAMGVELLFLLVCGALGWRLIWAILVTPRLNQVPPLRKHEEPAEPKQAVRVLLREPEPEPEPEYPCIEVITPREALPSGPIEVITPRAALPSGDRSIVRRVVR
jgi:hypothetical protein